MKRQPITSLVNHDDLLEKQLEGLFSDAVLPELMTTFKQPLARPAPKATLRSQLTPTVHPPEPLNKGRVLRPKAPALPKRLTSSLGALTIFMVLAYLLIERGNLTRLFNTDTPLPTTAGVAVYGASPVGTRTVLVTPLTTFAAVPQLLPGTHTPTPVSPTPTHVPRATATTTFAPTPTPRPTHTPTPSPSPVTPAATRTPTPAPTRTSTPRPTFTPTASLTPTPEAVLVIVVTPTPRPTFVAELPNPTQLAPTRLLIPAINLEAPIVEVGYVNYEIGGQTVTSWAVPNTFAVGWHHTSALPGQVGNTVLNGHQNIHGMVFRNLRLLQHGDEIVVLVGDTAYHYRVAEQHVLAEEGQPLEVRVQNARWIMSTQDERLTLVTCAPDGQNTHRLIVVALPAQPSPAAPPETQ